MVVTSSCFSQLFGKSLPVRTWRSLAVQSFSLSKPSHSCVFGGLLKPGGPFPLTSETSHIQTSESLMKESVWLQPDVCVYTLGCGVSLPGLTANCPLTSHNPATSQILFSTFLRRSSSKQTLLPPHAFFCDMPLCPLWTSCNTLSKQCQSRR